MVTVFKTEKAERTFERYTRLMMRGLSLFLMVNNRRRRICKVKDVHINILSCKN